MQVETSTWQSLTGSLLTRPIPKCGIANNNDNDDDDSERITNTKKIAAAGQETYNDN